MSKFLVNYLLIISWDISWDLGIQRNIRFNLCLLKFLDAVCILGRYQFPSHFVRLKMYRRTWFPGGLS